MLYRVQRGVAYCLTALVPAAAVLLAAAAVAAAGHSPCTSGSRVERAAKADGARPESPDSARDYRRIVSLSPSTTETLFALGLGDRVVGVTKFCNYPPEARRRQRVGGYLDPNYEVIASLDPDLVILLPEHEGAMRFLDELGLRHITVDNKTVRDIIETIETIGTACGAGMAAGALVESIESRMALIREATEGLPRPRVLVAVERTVEAGTLREVYVAGRGTHYDELLRAAGGINAYEGRRIDYPMLTAEGIIHCDPDIIIDIRPLIDADSTRIAGAVRDWETVSTVGAVKNGRVHVLTEDYAVVPGPRFITLLEMMVRIVHPAVKGDDR